MDYSKTVRCAPKTQISIKTLLRAMDSDAFRETQTALVGFQMSVILVQFGLDYKPDLMDTMCKIVRIEDSFA